MKSLWAPWRMEYIRRTKDRGCFLCHILQGSEDQRNLVLKRGRTCAVVINRYPYTNGHLMVCPNRHTASLADLSPDERLEAMDLTVQSVHVLQTALRAEGFNIGVNLGRVAGAGLEDHLHMHVVPRWQGDTNYIPVLAEVKVIPQHLEDLWAELHPHFHPSPLP